MSLLRILGKEARPYTGRFSGPHRGMYKVSGGLGITLVIFAMLFSCAICSNF